MKHAFARMANLWQTFRKPCIVYEDTQTKVDLSLICNCYDQPSVDFHGKRLPPVTVHEGSEERQTRATGEGAFPRCACHTLHARLVLRSPEKRGKIGPVLLAMSLNDLQRMRTKVNVLFHSFFYQG